MIPIRISLDPETYRQADKVARRQGITLAEFCRRTLSEAFARYPKDKPWMAYVGMFDGQPEDSTTVDDVIYGRTSP